MPTKNYDIFNIQGFFCIILTIYLHKKKRTTYSAYMQERSGVIRIRNWLQVHPPLESQDSPVYSPPRSCDSPVYSSIGSLNSPRMYTRGSWPKLIYKETSWCNVHQSVKTPLWLINWGVLILWSICHQNVFVTCSNTPRNLSPRCIPHREWRLPSVFTTGELNLRCIHYWWVILNKSCYRF